MELGELYKATLDLFQVSDIEELGRALLKCVKENDVDKYSNCLM